MTEKVTAGGAMTCLVAVGFNRSGIDSGELDYSIALARVLDLSDVQFAELLQTIDQARSSLVDMRAHSLHEESSE